MSLKLQGRNRSDRDDVVVPTVINDIDVVIVVASNEETTDIEADAEVVEVISDVDRDNTHKFTPYCFV